MKTINFTAIPCLKALLTKKKMQTIRPNPNPRFEIGESVKFYWNQRSKFKHFCPKCGKETGDKELLEDEVECCNHCFNAVKPFKKVLGFGTITDVFEIEMSNDYHNKLGIHIHDYKKGRYLTENEVIELSVLDGFDNPNEFADFFKNYDLRFVRSFYVYRWDWNEAI